ncbi:MAG: ABC transporter permease [Oscillospiraceae bacterium]
MFSSTIKSRSNFTGFTLIGTGSFSNETILNPGRHLLVAAVASVAATIIGTAAAIVYHMKNARGLIKNVTYLPIINPEIVTGVSLMLLFGFVNLRLGYATLILSHITFCIPYVILSVLPKLRQMGKHLFEAALDLGCSPWQAYCKVVLPEIMPGVVTGFLMALTYSIDDFIISYFTLALRADAADHDLSMTPKVSPEINALSYVFLVVLSVLLLMNLRDARAEKKAGSRERSTV